MAPPPSLATIFGLAFEMMPLILLALGKIQKNNRMRESSMKLLMESPNTKSIQAKWLFGSNIWKELNGSKQG